MSHHETYQYVEYSRSRSLITQDRSRAKSAISVAQPRICCECGGEECPYCGRSLSPPKNKHFFPEILKKEYHSPSKSTTHENYRSYENRRDRETLFSFPAGRANPDEVYFDRSINDVESNLKRSYSNIERYKEASPIMKRGLQSHISDILGYDDYSDSSSPKKEKYEREIFAQGLPPGIYRRTSAKSTTSLSPKSQEKKRPSWQRVSKQDISIDKDRKKKSGKRDETKLGYANNHATMTSQEAKWKSNKRDISPGALSKFQDKIKQASMLLKNSKSGAQEHRIPAKGEDEFMPQTYIDTRKSRDEVKVSKSPNRAREEQVLARSGPSKIGDVSPVRTNSKKSDSKSGSRDTIQSSQSLTEGGALIQDIFKRYGNANRANQSKPPSIQQIGALTREASMEGFQVKKKGSIEANMRLSGANGSNISTPVMTEPAPESHREENIYGQEVPAVMKSRTNARSQHESLNIFDSHASLNRENTNQVTQEIQKKSTLEIENHIALLQKEYETRKRAMLQQQDSLQKVSSQASLKRGDSIGTSQQMEKKMSFGLEQNNVNTTPFRIEQETHQQTNESIFGQEIPDNVARSIVIQSKSTVKSRQGSLQKINSQTSLNKEVPIDVTQELQKKRPFEIESGSATTSLQRDQAKSISGSQKRESIHEQEFDQDVVKSIGAQSKSIVKSQQGSLNQINSQTSFNKEGPMEIPQEMQKKQSLEIESNSATTSLQKDQPKSISGSQKRASIHEQEFDQDVVKSIEIKSKITVKSQHGSLNKVDSRASLNQEVLIEPTQEIKKRPSFEAETSPAQKEQDKRTLSQSGSSQKIVSQTSLKQVDTIEGSKQINKKSSFESNEGSITPPQSEQNYSRQKNPLMTEESLPNSEGQNSTKHQHNSEGKPPISKKPSLTKGESLPSFNRGSSIEEFRPNKESSVKDNGIDTELSSYRDEIPISDFSPIQRASLPMQRVSLLQRATTVVSQGSFGNGSSDEENQVRRRSPVNTMKTPFQTEPDQQEDDLSIDVTSIKKQNENEKNENPSIQSIADSKSGNLQQTMPATGASWTVPQMKKFSSMQDSYNPLLEFSVKFNSHEEGNVTVPELFKGDNNNEIKRDRYSLIKLNQVSTSQASLREPNEQNLDQEAAEKKPARINSWTDMRRDSSIPKPMRMDSSEEKNVNIEVVDSIVFVPSKAENKPQEIEDLLGVNRFVSDSDKDKTKPTKLNSWQKNVQPQQDALNESHTLEKSVSYEFSFEEQSYEKDPTEKSTGYSKIGGDLIRDTLINDNMMNKQNGYSKPPIVGSSMNRYKVATKPPITASNHFLTDDSKQDHFQNSPSEIHERYSAYADMKIDSDRGGTKEIRHLKAREQMFFGENQPNQSANEISASKTSFSLEPASAVPSREASKANCRNDFLEVKVIYKDDLREQMLKNFLDGKILQTPQTPLKNIPLNLARKGLFRYTK